MAIRIEPSKKTIDREDVAKTVAVAMAYGAAKEPHGAFRFSLDALVKLRPAKGGKAGERAWFLWQEALAGTLARVLPGEPWNMQPARLKQLTTDLLWASAERMRTSPIMLHGHHLERPRSFLPYESARRDIVLAVCTGPLADRRGELEKALNAAFRDAFAAARQAEPDYYTNLIDDRTSVPADRQRQWDEHRDRIGREIMVEPIFGQDRITLDDLYIPPRCIFSTTRLSQPDEDGEEEDPDFRRSRPERKLEAHVQDLRETVLKWWRTSDGTDRIRLIGGAPGSGKSSFAKMLAWEVGAEPEETVLFVPLHRIGGTDALRDHVRQYLTAANGGGFDAETDPLSWLGRSGQDDCLLIFDGLDELGEAHNPDRFGELVRNLRDMVVSLDGSENGGGRVRAVVLGRNIAVSEAREKLALSPEYWLEVLPMAPAPERGAETDDWVEGKAEQFGQMAYQVAEVLAGSDDRPTYWQKWQAAHRQEAAEMPPGLQPGNLDEFSAEPLLCYLLLFSGLADERWKEVEDNRGLLFRKILYDIHQRNWGADGGGHPSGPESFGQFLALMAGFALAAWHGGGRVGQTADYEWALGAYRPTEARKLLKKDFAQLKNVALMLHVRAEGHGEEKTFEFIHKSFGDYLVALALADAGLDWMDDLEAGSISEDDFLRRWLALTGSAPVTGEILDFLNGEVASDLADLKWTDEEHEWRGGVDLFVSSNRRRGYRSSGALEPSGWAEARLGILNPAFSLVLVEGFPAYESEGPSQTWRQREVRHRHAETSLLALVQALACVAWPFGISESVAGRLDFFAGEDVGTGERNGHLRSLVLRLITSNDSLAELARRRLFVRLAADSIDFRRQDLVLVDFSAAHLSGVDLSRAHLVGAHLVGAHLVGADLSGAHLSGAHLSRAHLSGADLSGADLSGADLSGADLRSADLSGADLRSADLSRVHLRSADLSRADLSGADLSRADLSGADLSRADLSGADLSRADLSGADLRSADLRSAHLSGAHLVGADLRSADLRSAHLSGADLSGAHLVGADLRSAHLSGADLSGAHLVGADLRSADLRSAHLSGADLSGAKIDHVHGLDDAGVAYLITRGAVLADSEG